MQTVKKSLEEQQHKTDDMYEKGRDTETTEGTANSYTSLKKPEVEIEKVVKAQKEAQSAA